MIFDDTIRNNVLYGSPDATEAEVWKALEDASLADFVRTLLRGSTRWWVKVAAGSPAARSSACRLRGHF